MSDNIPNPNEHLSLREASEVFGYHPDHLSRLIREGKLYGKRAGRGWVTTRAALAHYASGNYDLAAQAPLLSSPEYVSLKEASDLSGYHPDHLSRLIRQGALYGKRAGRGWATTRAALANYLSGNEELARQEVGIDPRFAASGGVRGLNLDELGDVADDPVLVQAPAMQEKVVAVPAPTPISTPVVSIPGPRGILRGSRKRVVSARSIALVLAAPVAGALLSFGVLAALDNEAGAGSLQGIASRVKGVVESTSNIALQGFSGTFLQNYAAEFATLNTKLDKVGQGVEELLGRTPQVVREEVAVTEVTNNITQEVTNLTQENIVEEVSDGRIVSAVENTNLSGLSVVGLSDLDNVNVNGRLSVDGSFAVAGAVTAPTFKGGRIEVGSAQLGSLTVVDSATLSGDIELGGTLATVAISSGNWNISAAGVADFTQLTVDNIHIDGNTLSSLEGGITFTPFAGEGVSFSLTGSSTFAVNTDDFVVDTATGNISSAGQLQLPTTGSSAGILLGGDVALYRTASNRLNLGDDDILTFPNRDSHDDIFAESAVSGDAFYRFQVTADGTLAWGPGNALRDTNLYRDDFNTLATDDSFEVGGNLTVIGDLSVFGISANNGDVVLGDAVTDTITFTGVVNSDITPETSTTYDLGSASRRWANGYFDTVTANTLTGVVAGGATTSPDWTINSDNATANAELSTLSFETGTGDFNATLQWNAAGDAGRVSGFDDTIITNYPLAVYSEVSGGSQTFTSGTLFSYSQPAAHAITQSGALTGIEIDFSSNITNATGAQTGIALTLKDGNVSGGSSGITVAGTADYGIDLSPATYNLGALILPIGTTPESGIDFSGAAGDVVLYRSAAGTLSTNGRFTVGSGSSGGVLFGADALLYRISANTIATGADDSFFIGKDLWVDEDLSVVGDVGVIGDFWVTELYEFGGTTISGDGIKTVFDILSDGKLQLPTSGSVGGIVLGGDAQLYRGIANGLFLGTDDFLRVTRSTTGAGAIQIQISGEAQNRLLLESDGSIKWGSGAAAPDVELVRGAANRLDLASGDSLNLVGGSLQVGGVTVLDASRIGSFSSISSTGVVYSGSDDTTSGNLSLYGGSGGTGGLLRLFLGATQDTSDEYWQVWPNGTALNFALATSGTKAVLTATGQLQLPTSGSSAGLLLGGDVQLYRNAANELRLNSGSSFTVDGSHFAVLNASSSTATVFASRATGQTQNPFRIGANGTFSWGNGTDAADTALYRGAANRLDLASGDSLNIVGGDLAVNSDDFYVQQSTGRVGIGTTGPNARLHIDSSTSAANMFEISRISTNNSLRILNYNGTNTAYNIQTTSDNWDTAFDVLSLKATGTAVGVGYADLTGVTGALLVNGNVGIGTTNPSNKLEVVGNLGLTSNNPLLFLGPANGTFTSTNYHTLGYALNDGYHVSNSLAGDFTIGARASANIRFGTSTSGIPTARLNILSDGKVGVGTTDPQSILHVRAGSSNSVLSGLTLGNESTAENVGVAIDFRNHTTTSVNTARIIAQRTTAANSNSELQFWNFIGGALQEALTINESGQIQAPFTGSSAGLLIGGDVQLYRSAANQLTIPDSVLVQDGSLWVKTAGGAQQTNIRLGVFEDGASTALYEFSTADVGGDKLDLHSNRWASNVIFSRSSVDGYQEVAAFQGDDNAGNRLYIYDATTTTAKILLRSNSYSYFNGGDVLIGGSSIAPLDKLEVFGASANIRINNTDETEAGIIFSDAQDVNGQNASLLFDASSSLLSTYVNNSAVARFSSAGQFQLPTTGSSAGLLIGGDAQLYRGAANRLDLASGDSLNIVSGQIFAGGSSDTGLFANTGLLLAGDAASTHLSLDANEIMAKASGTTAGTLYIQNEGGSVRFLEAAKGTFTVNSDAISVNASNQISMGGPLTLRKGDGSSNDIGRLYGGSDGNDYIEINGAGSDDHISFVLASELARITGAGQFQLPTTGSSAGLLLGGDVQLYRGSADMLYLGRDDKLRITRSGSGAGALEFHVSGDTQNRMFISSSGSLNWGSGSAVQDTSLYRSAANILKTDDSFEVGGAIRAAEAPTVALNTTLTTIDSTGDVGSDASLAIGTDGLPIISYYDATDTDLKVAHCENASCSTSTITTVDSTGSVGRQTSIAIGADGLPVISYLNGGAVNDLKLAHCDDVSCSSATLTTIDSVGSVGFYSSIAIGADGNPIISYYDTTNDDLKVAHCENASCSASTITTVDSTGDVGTWSSIAIGADDLAVISYYDATNADLKVAHCDNISCSSSTVNSVVSADFAGTYSSIAIGADGFPLISYYSATNNALELIDCGDAFCTSTIQTVVDPGANGAHTSITLSTEGLPIISYFSLPTDTLKLAHCSTVSCSNKVITTIDHSMGSFAGHTSIAIGTDGNPVISYYTGDPNRDLKVAHIATTYTGGSNIGSATDFFNNIYSANLNLADSPSAGITFGSGNGSIDLYRSAPNTLSVSGGSDLTIVDGSLRFGAGVNLYQSAPQTLGVAGGLSLSGDILASVMPMAAGVTQTITTVDATGGARHYTSIAIGTDGLPVISYLDDINDDLKVAKCTAADCSTSTLTTVDATDNVGLYTSIAIGTDGLPIISYRDDTNQDLKVAKCTAADCSTSTLTTVDATGNVGQFTSIAIGTDGLPVISYRDSSSAALKVAKCDDSSCSTSTTIIVDSSDVQFTAIATGVDGNPVVAYYAIGTGDLKVAHCTDISCTAPTLTTVDATGTVGQWVGIAIGTDGLPVISYRDVTNSDLKVAKCTDISCTASTLTTVDATGTVGDDTSIAIGTDGLPVISYYDTTNGDLKVAKCTAADCSTSTLTTVDATDNVGENTSIAIGTDGLPVISYRDVTNSDLKVAKCGTPSCSGNGYAPLGGSNIGSLGNHFNNVYANQYWGKSFSIANFDLAEEYFSEDSLTPGTIVSVYSGENGREDQVQQSSTPYEETLMGIVSTQPGITLADWQQQDKTGMYPIALAGRVPVKVSNENGDIKPGDAITSSSVPGVGMKATQPGRIVGIALTGFEADGEEGEGADVITGTVTVFVSTGYHIPSEYFAALAEGEEGGAVAFLQNFVDLVLKVRTLVASLVQTDRIEVKNPYGITIYDTVTGEPYCVVSVNGKLESIAGTCEEVAEGIEPTPEEQQVEEESVQEPDAEPEGQTEEQDAESVVEESQQEGAPAEVEEEEVEQIEQGTQQPQEESSGEEQLQEPQPQEEPTQEEAPQPQEQAADEGEVQDSAPSQSEPGVGGEEAAPQS